MARIADASLAGAVSEAGGLGIIACGGAPLDWVEEQVRIARSITDKPIGANVMLMDPNTGETVKMPTEEEVEAEGDTGDLNGYESPILPEDGSTPAETE